MSEGQEKPQPRSRWSRVRGYVVELAILAAVFAAITAWQGRKLVGTGEPAPQLSLATLDGGRFELAALKGKKVLVVFWAPWCGVCKQDVGAVNSVARGAGEDYVVVSVAAAYRDAREVEAFVREQGVRYPVLLGDDADTKRWAVGAFPTAYVIDEQGRIEHAVVGYTTTLGFRLRLL